MDSTTRSTNKLYGFFQIAYAVFLAVYTYICLVRTPIIPSWPELYVTACMINYGAEKIRTLIAAEPSGFLEKLRVWHTDTKWNIFDVITISTFLLAFGARCIDGQWAPYARVTYATVICYW
jgi:hypothetical protein